MWSVDPWGVLKTLSRVLIGRNNILNNIETLFALFHCADICHNGAKAMADETVGTLTHIKAGSQTVVANDFTNL